MDGLILLVKEVLIVEDGFMYLIFVGVFLSYLLGN